MKAKPAKQTSWCEHEPVKPFAAAREEHPETLLNHSLRSTLEPRSASGAKAFVPAALSSES